MDALAEERPIAKPNRPPAPERGWLFWPMLLLAGYLLFAHGCHGDEDNELFLRLGGPDITAKGR
jgi:hypothetical protein